MKNNTTPFIHLIVKSTKLNLTPMYIENKLRMWMVIIASLKRGFKGQNDPKTVASLAQKGKSANTRRLGFVCYKHALIRFLNRFTWKRIHVLRRKHATL